LAVWNVSSIAQQATTEREHGRSFAGDVEAVGLVVDDRVAVGRGGVGEHQRAGGNGDPGVLDVAGGPADGAENDGQ
jgi:hypothetical protein